MRLWHLVSAVAVVAVVMTLARDLTIRVFMITFVTGLGEVVFGTTAMMALFQTVGALGDAKRLSAGVGAIAATSVVLAIATAVMSAWLFAGAWCVWAST
jgi:hypothetical protein